ncbi:MAG: RNA-binding protein [Bacteroidetes bacterium HGW-Bacteroidetes-15]|nr:MAG: RNA-binding protein [Bacteroidetes bacterium HGW-Bacteroidetes-15]
MKIFKLDSEYIPLIQLLKVMRIANSGGEAQAMVEDGLVTLNGKPESRKRAKIRDGDIIKCGKDEVVVKRIQVTE